eukprot:scaffold530004_cov19-Prasinocladus_malaysianus.AAC.1
MKSGHMPASSLLANLNGRVELVKECIGPCPGMKPSACLRLSRATWRCWIGKNHVNMNGIAPIVNE